MKNSAFIKLAGEHDALYEDIYTEYGVSFVKGSYLQLIRKGATKAYVSNDSRLQHGIRMVAKPEYSKLNSRNIQVTILLEANSRAQYVSRIEAFTDKITRGLFCLKIPSCYRVFRLVYTDMKIKQEFRDNRATFTLEMTEPNPDDRTVL